LEDIGKAKVAARAEALRRIKAQQEVSTQKCQIEFDLNLSSFLKKQKGFWSAYRSIPGEISPVVSIQKNQQIRWAFPRVKEKGLEFYLEPKTWIKGSFGIDEPDPVNNELIPLQEINACLIPGLAFDRRGTRIGRGLGFFDRALESYQGLKVGLAFDTQLFSEELPRDVFDVPMDIVITNKDIFLINHHPNQVIEGERRND
jgi:5-formyltetrahydrofolate cyclo-ligase